MSKLLNPILNSFAFGVEIMSTRCEMNMGTGTGEETLSLYCMPVPELPDVSLRWVAGRAGTGSPVATLGIAT